MAKRKKYALIILAVIVMLAFSFVGFFALNNQSDSAENTFKSDLQSITSEYDTADKFKSKDKFALCRLIVSDYNGDTFGAVKSAVDSKHNIAVLQYETQTDAKNAYNKIKKAGLTVDADCPVELDETQSYDKCEISPAASQKVGFNTYLNNFKMNKEDVLVAVIDSSVMTTHPALSGRFYNDGYDFSADGYENAVFRNSFTADKYFHSTFVSGIIANNTADNVKIVPYKVFTEATGYATASNVIAAINDAVDLGVDVINLSLTSTDSASAYYKAVQNAIGAGVCVCASAGNSAADASKYYPAATDGTITVSALNSKFEKIASYSNYGDCVDFCAPGSKIMSSVVLDDGTAGYEQYSGTSAACPYIAAACADIKSMNKSLSRDDVYKILNDFSVDYGDKGFDIYYGNGLPDISKIVYTDNECYSYSLPQGELTLTKGVDYTQSNRPWRLFDSKIISVKVEKSVSSIGDWTFYNMSNADFTFAGDYISVGESAFLGCSRLDSFTFGDNISYIGEDAFADTANGFVINGFRNTAAESYAAIENIKFNIIGCKHNYLAEIIEPTDSSPGSTLYTCSVCGDSYSGDYIKTTVVSSGKCGDGMTYSLNNIGTLTLSGAGEMYDYSSSLPPWQVYSKQIKSLAVSSGITKISPFAFYGCESLCEIKSSSENLKAINKSLYDSTGSELILAVKDTPGCYTMPQGVKKLNSTAFLALGSFTLIPNDNFTVASSVVYDKSGNIVAALPSYKTQVLTVSDNVSINDYAFILSEYPQTVRNYCDTLSVGKYSFGYSFNGAFQKNDFTYYGYVDAPAYTYCVENGFAVNLLNAGNCGENAKWYFNTQTKSLKISGSGDMTVYKNAASVPWHDYIGEIISLEIDDDITALSPYAFYGASAMKSLKMPLSIAAPTSNTVWYSCNAIESIELTLGSGTMPDYGAYNSSKIYTYSPWYISRESIKSFSIDKNAAKIGSYAFRGCDGITSVTLDKCDNIGKYAFYDCKNLTDFTITSKTTTISSNAVFAYSSAAPENICLYAYSDSTAADYAKKMKLNFSSLGCDHTRGYVADGVRASCCYDCDVSYYCKDCNALIYKEFIKAASNGHHVKGRVVTTEGKAIYDALVYVDGSLAAVTNHFGYFVLDNVLCEVEHTVEIKKHDKTIASTVVNTNKHNRSGTIVIKYGNFLEDNIVNGKDFALALHSGYTDTELIDLGYISGEKFDIKNGYDVQVVPNVMNSDNEPKADSDYSRTFTSQVYLGREYTVTECGFIYGKNMDSDMLTLENVGKTNSGGYVVKRNSQSMQGVYDTRFTAFFNYGSSSKTGTVSAKFYIKYTNGVKTYVSYGDASSYTY